MCFLLARSGSHGCLESVDESSVSDFMTFSADGSMLIGLVLSLCCTGSWGGLLTCLRCAPCTFDWIGVAGALLFGWSVSGDSCGNKLFKGRSNGVVSSMREMGIIGMNGYGTVVLVIMCKVRYLD